MTTAPKFYKHAKPVVRNQEALDRHCEEMADNLAALSKSLREKNKLRAKPQIETVEAPDEGEKEHAE